MMGFPFSTPSTDSALFWKTALFVKDKSNCAIFFEVLNSMFSSLSVTFQGPMKNV